MISHQDWSFYEQQGYLKLGRLLEERDLAALQERIDQIMLGAAALDYSGMMMQLDTDTGRYSDMKEHTLGHKGPTRNYRKIQNLEHDPLFLGYMQRPIFREICDRVLGPAAPVACFRAMFMNKPARKGTRLPWHQDRWSHLDRDPLITLWTALDPATIANGCVQIIPQSHKLGIINPAHASGFLTEEQTARFCPQEKVVHLELEPGECALLHNWLLHSSDINQTDTPRRAFSVCYMDASTKASNNERFTTIFSR